MPEVPLARGRRRMARGKSSTYKPPSSPFRGHVLPSSFYFYVPYCNFGNSKGKLYIFPTIPTGYSFLQPTLRDGKKCPMGHESRFCPHRRTGGFSVPSPSTVLTFPFFAARKKGERKSRTEVGEVITRKLKIKTRTTLQTKRRLIRLVSAQFARLYFTIRFPALIWSV